jgi:5-(carboxyamino)imidazole ribonucleotide synthase
MTKVFLPGANIGVMGGGQLGRMFAVAARRMGYRVTVFSPEPQGPAAQFADSSFEADYSDEAQVREFVRHVDLVTFEFENIPDTTAAWCAEHVPVRPSGYVLHTAQHRLREKTFLRDNGFPLPAFRPVNSAADLKNALQQIGRDAILKTAAWGYDGKGQQAVTSAPAEQLWEQRSADELILEKKIEFEKEISVIVARSPDEKVEVLPVAENVHVRHILDVTLVPARISRRVAKQAVELACAVAEKLDLVGLLAVEMFVNQNGEVLVNELAPRPHNSGHWSIEGCLTSQFEQHVRAVCGLELGATDLLQPSAMANLLGDIWQAGEPDWASALKVPGVHLHLYGKRDPRPRRKMGHLTAVAPRLEVAESRVRAAREHLCRPRS